MEEHITFESDGLMIEGLLERVSQERGIIITHPHPHYGGNMYNNIVEIVKCVARDHGLTTLRFNFRGTGRSQGKFDGGVGEQNDLLNAVAFLKDLGIDTVDLGGYSFGAWIISKCFSAKVPQVDRVVMVSPPIDILDFNDDVKIKGLSLVISGDDDMYDASRGIQKKAAMWSNDVHIEIIHGADHFYSGCMGKLERALEPFFNR